jgi:hypothetical protein
MNFNENKVQVVETSEKRTSIFIPIYQGTESKTIIINNEDIPFLGNVNLYLYNLLGNIVMKKQRIVINAQSIELDLSQLSKGVYFLHITNGIESITKKIILD